jgi:Ca-activated chloride channel family protein
MDQFASIICAMAVAAVSLAGCAPSGVRTEATAYLSEKDAKEELSELIKKIKYTQAEPVLDIYSSTESNIADELAPIDTYPVVVTGKADIVVEIATGTEKSSGKNDNDSWFDQLAERFNKQGNTIGGKTVAVSIRSITAGDALTYIADGNYRPDAYAPANTLWGDMLSSRGIPITMVKDKLAGNTAGILMKKETYDTFVKNHGDPTIDKVLQAALDGEFLFAYTNPYTSSTGLNIFSSMLRAFDPENPLSDKAAQKLLDYQKTAPPVAFSTGVMREQAAKGIIEVMVMERQAYINTPTLKDFVFTPEGVRHDNPLYTFGWVSAEKQEAVRMFAEYALGKEAQDIATKCGFNYPDDAGYVGRPSGLDGAGLLAAQRIWKVNKDGGRPIVAVFICDTSGSMNGLPINSLKDAAISAASYIGSNNYVGVVSYGSTVTVNLPIAEFNDRQRAYFNGTVKALRTGGGTATYDAVLVGMDLLLKAQEGIPDAKLMLFVLSDGEQNEGYTLDKITPIVGGLKIPVYGIEFNSDSTDLSKLAQINEAVSIKASSDNLINQLRGLFNVQM